MTTFSHAFIEVVRSAVAGSAITTAVEQNDCGEFAHGLPRGPMIAVLWIRSLAGSSELPPLPFSGEEFLLRLAQRRGQLRISTVIGQKQDLEFASPSPPGCLVRRCPLPPMRPRLSQKMMAAMLPPSGSEQIAGDCRIGLRYPRSSSSRRRCARSSARSR